MTHYPSVKQFGLTQVYTPPRGETPTVDIVFVHGLNGHPQNSWSSKTNGCFWPVDLLPEVLAPLRPRILTYGYNASVAAFTDGASRDSVVSHAETLASTLAANRNLRNCLDRPIIFVCHSLGGLVVKRALIYSRSLSNEKTEHLRSVYVSTFGILFLGTPHNGSDVAKWGLLLHKICTSVLPKKVMEGSPQLIKSLQTNNETLQHINSLFADIMSRFHIYLFHETRSMDVKGTREIIVDEASAAPYFEGVERGGIEADHSHMCKFDDENSPGYEVVAEAILRYSRQAPSVIADRWIEERKTRTLEKKAKAREIYDGTDEPVGQSLPDLNTTATGHSVPVLPRGAATHGRNSPVSELGKGAVGPLSRSLNSLPSQKDPALFVAPPGFHPNATFFGMKKQMEELHRRLFKAKARVERTMAVLIAGVPGSGKTHLARQYVFAQRECYTGGIFWVDARSREAAFKCFWEIAQAATLMDPKEAHDPKYQESGTYVDAVRNWLQSRHEWLLVFDGITFDHDEDINKFRPFLPWNKRCSIIYTSIDSTLRKKQRLFEPYCLSVPRLKVEDACSLLYKDLGIRRPTAEQASKAKELVEHYECLPLAIHAIGHRLNATGRPIERYRVKHQVTDKKLAEPFLCIMNDLYRLNQREALNLVNLLSFLDHHVPVGLLNLGRSELTLEDAEILSSAQSGEDPDLDTTLGTLIHYGLIERTSDADPSFQQTPSAQNSSDEMHAEPKATPQLSDSFTETSQDGFFSIYRGNSTVDVVKIHSVVQGFCRDELKIKDEDYRELNKQDPGFYDSWLIVATRFLCRSYETAKERMAHYHDCGLVRDYREYETHASRLAEHFPKKTAIGDHPQVLREARESLRQLMKSISKEIDRMSPTSSQESARNQKSVFDRSSSSSSSFPSSADEGGLSRQSTWNWTESGSLRAESPEEMMAPRFKLELFPPHIFRQPGSESDDGYETDGEAKEPPRISPALSQMSQATERPNQSPPSSSPPQDHSQNWQLVERHSKTRPTGPKRPSKRPRGPRRLQGSKPDTPLVEISPIQGQGSSSRVSSSGVPSDRSIGSSILASVTETALAAVRRISNGSSSSSSSNPPLSKKENVPTYASITARRILEGNEAPPRHPASRPISGGSEVSAGLQLKPSVESLNIDSQASHVFASPLAHELMTHEIITEPLARSNYSDPGREYIGQSFGALDLHTAPTSQINSRRPSVQANIEPTTRDLSASTPTVLPYEISIRELSASTPSLAQYPPPPLPFDQDITITIPNRRSVLKRAAGPSSATLIASQPAPVAHPSAIMPGAHPLSVTASDSTVIRTTERPGSEALSRGSSGFSRQSWSTEPVRSPPRFSPASSFAQPSDITRSSTPLLQQQHSLSSAGSWTSERPLSSSVSAIQSDNLYPIPPSTQQRLGSVDERLRTIDLAWNLGTGTAQPLHFGGHRVDVRDPRQRLHEVGRIQAPRHVPTYQLFHSNLSGPLVQRDGLIYAPAPTLEVYGGRARSGSSPSRPDYNGVGVQFNDRVFD